jgi:hypothetical protein
VYDDKASDYEDIWSPQYYERSHTPRLSTFKPDLIPSSITPEVDNIIHSLCHTPNQNNATVGTIPCPKNPSSSGVDEESIIVSKNIQNHRLSLHGGVNGNANETRIEQSNRSIEDLNKQINKKGLVGSSKEDLLGLNNGEAVGGSGRKSAGLYSEPVDSLSFKRFGNNSNRNSEPTARWSQPVLSLPKLDITSGEECRKDRTGSGINGKWTAIEQKVVVRQDNNVCRTFQESAITQQSRNIIHRSSLADVSLTNKSSGSQMCASRISSNSSSSSSSKITQKKQTVTCASVDNLCHLRDFGKKSKKISVPESEKKKVGSQEEVSDSCVVLSPRKCLIYHHHQNEYGHPNEMCTSRG